MVPPFCYSIINPNRGFFQARNYPRRHWFSLSGRRYLLARKTQQPHHPPPPFSSPIGVDLAMLATRSTLGVTTTAPRVAARRHRMHAGSPSFFGGPQLPLCSWPHGRKLTVYSCFSICSHDETHCTVKVINSDKNIYC